MPNDQPDFAGLRVAAFASRRRDEMVRLIERAGGVPHVSPAVREVPIQDNADAVDFAHRLITGQVDVVILLTGVGFRHLVTAVGRQVDRERFLAILSDVTTITRGSKVVAALAEFGLEPKYQVGQPNTWREILELIDEHVPVANQTVALQEYGMPNPSLVAGLEARGATVLGLKVYDWEMPEDTTPLEDNIWAILDGRIDVVLFTAGVQAVNMMRVAESLTIAGDLRRKLSQAVVGSIGSVASDMLRRLELPVDFEPERSKTDVLVATAAARARDLLGRKGDLATALAAVPGEQTAGESRPPWHDSPFMKAARREPTTSVPVWLMRQAGRFMAEYREVRAKTTFLDLCKNPALCAEVAITARDRLGVDAAIIFSDLLPILEPMGMDLEYAAGEGPVIHNPVREAADVDRVEQLQNVESLNYVMQTVRLTRQGLQPEIPLLGFAGAPFTLASYCMEGGASRSYLFTKTLMYRDRGAWDELLGRLARSIVIYLNAQIAAGAQAVQLFDSWVGCLSPDDYRRYVLPHTKSVIDAVTPGVPVIHFATGNPALLPLIAEAGGSVIGLDWRVRLAEGWRAVGYDRAVQGNLDPLALLAEKSEIRHRAKEIIDQTEGRPGFIFNLGHGVIPQTPVENAIELVEVVHELGQKK